MEKEKFFGVMYLTSGRHYTEERMMELQKGEAERRKAMLEGRVPQQPEQPTADNIDDLLEMYK